MIPDTTTVSEEDGIVTWQNDSFDISVAEAESIADEVRSKMSRPTVEGVLVDNRNADGAWPTDVDDVWSSLMEDIYGEGVQCATVSPNATNAMQINRLSRKSGTDDLIKAFQGDEYDEAREFAMSG